MVCQKHGEERDFPLFRLSSPLLYYIQVIKAQSLLLSAHVLLRTYVCRPTSRPPINNSRYYVVHDTSSSSSTKTVFWIKEFNSLSFIFNFFLSSQISIEHDIFFNFLSSVCEFILSNFRYSLWKSSWLVFRHNRSVWVSPFEFQVELIALLNHYSAGSRPTDWLTDWLTDCPPLVRATKNRAIKPQRERDGDEDNYFQKSKIASTNAAATWTVKPWQHFWTLLKRKGSFGTSKSVDAQFEMLNNLIKGPSHSQLNCVE